MSMALATRGVSADLQGEGGLGDGHRDTYLLTEQRRGKAAHGDHVTSQVCRRSEAEWGLEPGPLPTAASTLPGEQCHVWCDTISPPTCGPFFFFFFPSVPLSLSPTFFFPSFLLSFHPSFPGFRD